MSTLQQREILHLSLLDGVGPAAIMRVAQAVERGLLSGSNGIYSARESDFVRLGFSPSIAQKLVAGLRDALVLEKELALAERYKTSWATVFDPVYPELLKHIHLPPSVLYWQGDLTLKSDAQAPTLAIVGSRKANWYGKQVIDLLVPPLVAQGCAIVSGGALGADSMAHAATVAAGGKTIAVLGSGLLDPYPASNKSLFFQILDNGGALVSPFPLMMHASPGSFPARNRVIAGMSVGCIVAQAAAKSGALITAQFALEQGRDVFAVPGPIEDPLCAGCHALVRQGALLVTCADDILGEYGGALAPMRGSCSERDAQVSLFEEGESPEHQSEVRVKKKFFSGAERASSGHPGVPDYPEKKKALTPEDTDKKEGGHSEAVFDMGTPHGQIMNCCASPQSLDDLALQTALPFAQLYELLFELQMQGALEQNAVGMWHRAR